MSLAETLRALQLFGAEVMPKLGEAVVIRLLPLALFWGIIY